MQTKLYVGLDLHSNNTYVGVIDSKERRVLKGKFPNQLEVILGVLEPHKERIVGVVVESTFNWYWLVDGLMDNGYKVHLAHPAAFQQYNGLKHTDDEHETLVSGLTLLHLIGHSARGAHHAQGRSTTARPVAQTSEAGPTEFDAHPELQESGQPQSRHLHVRQRDQEARR
jgi:hypothetical protein